MNWLRSKAKRLSLLALFALALQLGLSFGHVHAGFAVAGKTSIFSEAATPSSDSGGDTDGRQDLCAICATVALANSVVVSAPPVLPLPVEVKASGILPTSTKSGTITHLLGFQSRAPPLA